MRIENPDSISKSPDGRPIADQPIWREQFPIDWPTDDFRSRRDFTKLLGLTSLAFVAGQTSAHVGLSQCMHTTGTVCGELERST